MNNNKQLEPMNNLPQLQEGEQLPTVMDAETTFKIPVHADRYSFLQDNSLLDRDSKQLQSKHRRIDHYRG